MPREVDTHTRRAAAILTRLEQHARRGKMVALTASDADTLARHIRELARAAEGQKLLAETMAINPTMNSRAARARVAKEA